MESFHTLYEAQLLLDHRQLEYNHYPPHQSLNYQAFAEYAPPLEDGGEGQQLTTLMTIGPKNGVRSRPLHDAAFVSCQQLLGRRQSVCSALHRRGHSRNIDWQGLSERRWRSLPVSGCGWW